MYSSPRPGTPYITFTPKTNNDYFQDLGIAASTAPASNGRPITPYEMAGDISPSGDEYFANTTTRLDQYGVGLGIGAPITSFKAAGKADSPSRSTSGNLSDRRPSLRIVGMPPSPMASNMEFGRTQSSSGSSSEAESDTTLTALRSFSINSDLGIGRARFKADMGDCSDAGDTPTVSTFALAMRNAQRKSTPYPSNRDAYFGDEDEEEEEAEEEDVVGDCFVSETSEGAARMRTGQAT